MSFDALISTMDAAVLSHLGGVPVVYAPATGSPVTVQGIFDENYTLLEAGQNGVENLGPAVSLRIADLPGNPANDTPTLTIKGRQYRVRERQPDSIGQMITLLLHRSDL